MASIRLFLFIFFVVFFFFFTMEFSDGNQFHVVLHSQRL